MKLIYIVLLAINFVSITSVSAQTYVSYKTQTLALRSDFTPKSTLFTDLLPENNGNLSQIIGVAQWQDNNKYYQCRSLLEFDFNFLEKFIPAIQSAELVLFPLQIEGVKKNMEEKDKFLIKRVLNQWEDSLITWNNQPLAASERDMRVVKILANKKNKPVRVDVTEMVRNMMLKGNHGFLLTYAEDGDQTANSQFFASSQHDDSTRRPLLLITYTYSDIKPALPIVAFPTGVRQDTFPQQVFSPAVSNIPAPIKVDAPSK